MRWIRSSKFMAVMMLLMLGMCYICWWSVLAEQTDIINSKAIMEIDSVKRILYVVTSGSEFNDDRLSLAHLPKDRLMDLVVPVTKESIESMITAGFEVHLYLILGYQLRPQREKLLQIEFANASIEIWDDAFPLNYNDDYIRMRKQNPVKISAISRALSRQHRFVVRDKLFDYDAFAAFEDDMLVTGSHVRHYLHMTRVIQEFKDEAAITAANNEELRNMSEGLWFGRMSQQELAHMRPGFIRVEVIPYNTKKQFAFENVPVDLDFDDLMDSKFVTTKSAIDSSICCHVNHIRKNGSPTRPASSQIMIWETAISGIGVRELPDGSWVGVLNGAEESIGKFEAASNRKLADRRRGNDPQLYAQPAGWIQTRRQVLELHLDLCHGSFLPPYNDKSTFPQDGLWQHGNEYWGGGLQMWLKDCNITRIISLTPKNFSKHLLYHVSNNKQRLMVPWRQVQADTLLGQLNTIRKDATRSKLDLLRNG